MIIFIIILVLQSVAINAKSTLKDHFFIGASISHQRGILDNYNLNIAQALNTISLQLVSNSDLQSQEVNSGSSVGLTIGTRLYDQKNYYVEGSFSYGPYRDFSLQIIPRVCFTLFSSRMDP